MPRNKKRSAGHLNSTRLFVYQPPRDSLVKESPERALYREVFCDSCRCGGISPPCDAGIIVEIRYELLMQLIYHCVYQKSVRNAHHRSFTPRDPSHTGLTPFHIPGAVFQPNVGYAQRDDTMAGFTGLDVTTQVLFWVDDEILKSGERMSFFTGQALQLPDEKRIGVLHVCQTLSSSCDGSYGHLSKFKRRVNPDHLNDLKPPETKSIPKTAV